MSNDRLIMEVLTVSFIAMEFTLKCNVWHILSVVYEIRISRIGFIQRVGYYLCAARNHQPRA